MSMILRSFKSTAIFFNNILKSQPLATMSITTGLTMGLGGYICQKIQNRHLTEKKPISIKQIVDYGLFGALITGPGLRYWLYALDLRIFKNREAFLRPVKMMIVDVVTFRFSIIAAFIFYVSYLEKKSVEAGIADLKEKLGPVLLESVKIWPAATLLNFYLVPLLYRFLFSNTVALIWNTYMAVLITKKNEVSVKQNS